MSATPAFPPRATARRCATRPAWLGAWVSDLGLFLFGFSAWWLVPVGLRAWLSGAGRAAARGADDGRRQRCLARWLFWVGSGAAAVRQLRAGMDAAVPLGIAAARPRRRRAGLHARARCRCAGWALPARACCGSPRWWWAWRWRCAFPGCAWPSASASGSTRLREHRRSDKREAEDRRLGEQALREREIVRRGRTQRGRGATCRW